MIELLRYPVRTTMYYGFDGINLADQRQLDQDWWRWLSAVYAYDHLLVLAEALGVIRVENPEAGLTGLGPAIEDLLTKIDDGMGFRVDFPNPFEGELGIQSSRGLISTRAVLSLYDVWRIFDLVHGNRDVSVLEIGAGLGRNAYYAQKLGLKKYTIVDLPTTNAAQANFLGRVLDEKSISLFGEPDVAPIRILPQETVLNGSERFDIVANIDSMSEMSRSTAIEYLRFAKAGSRAFLSINHEANKFKISDLLRELDPTLRISRNPWWMNRGYVENICSFGH